MEFRYTRTAAPATTPISLDDAKAQLREEDTDYDSEITFMIDAATEYLDGPFGALGRCVVTQTWSIGCDFPKRSGPAGAIPIKIGNLQSVSSITYRDANGETQTLASSAYAVITGEGGCVYPVGGLTWPETSSNFIDPVTITVVVGYADAGGSPAADGLRANIPGGLQQAIKLHVSHMFEHRDIVAIGTIATDLPKSYDSLIAPYRLVTSGEKQ